MTIIVFIVALESPAGKLGDNLFFFFFVSSSSQSAMEAFLLRHRGQVSKKRVCSEWPWHYSSPLRDEKTNKRQDQIKKKKGRQACERPYLQKEKKKIAEERRDRKKYMWGKGLKSTLCFDEGSSLIVDVELVILRLRVAPVFVPHAWDTLVWNDAVVCHAQAEAGTHYGSHAGFRTVYFSEAIWAELEQAKHHNKGGCNKGTAEYCHSGR